MLSAGEHRGSPSRPLRKAPVTHRIHAAMDPVKVSLPGESVDRIPGVAEPLQLPHRDDSVLAGRGRGHLLMTWTILFSHRKNSLVHVGHEPTWTRKVSRGVGAADQVCDNRGGPRRGAGLDAARVWPRRWRPGTARVTRRNPGRPGATPAPRRNPRAPRRNPGAPAQPRAPRRNPRAPRRNAAGAPAQPRAPRRNAAGDPPQPRLPAATPGDPAATPGAPAQPRRRAVSAGAVASRPAARHLPPQQRPAPPGTEPG